MAARAFKTRERKKRVRACHKTAMARKEGIRVGEVTERTTENTVTAQVYLTTTESQACGSWLTCSMHPGRGFFLPRFAE